MQLLQNISLKPYNTFGMDVPAEYFMELHDAQELKDISADESLPAEKQVLGGGSNILLTKPVTGLLIHNRIKGIGVVKEDATHVWVQAGAGETWHQLVLYAIAHGYGGIENLSLIPGTVGAAPMQNIGAYGTEVKDTIDSVTGWHWEEQAFVNFTNAECRFGYRDSIFKQELKNKIFITSVIFRLDKVPQFNTSYGAIEQELKAMGVQELSVKAISDAVTAIRRSKLPDPAVTGNAGSFFKNPTVGKEIFETLRAIHPTIPSYPVSDDTVKIPAGWLIEQCNWKGYRRGDTGVHPKQALVLVNYGLAKGNDIWDLSGDIVHSVQERFGIELEREVQVW